MYKHCINGVSFEMEEGEVVILRPQEYHVFTEQTEMLELFSISVVKEEIEPLLEAYHVHKAIFASADSIRFTLPHNLQHVLLSAFRHLDYISKQQKKIQIRIILGDTIHEYMNMISRASSDWLERILMQMHHPENLKEGIPAFLRVSNLSHAQLCRVVKKKTGKTPQQYIKELRLNYAYELLLSTGLSCEEIAFSIGYNSLSHFITSFKEQFDATPSSLRRNSDTLL